jgi:DNA polymerase-3 subunit delta'
MALRLEHPDLHWHFPLPRPSGASTPERLAAALEEARAEELAALREDPLRPSWSDEARAIYLAAAQTLRRRAHSRPSVGERQVFVVGDAETLVPQESSPEAANALLKLLEEPPSSATFILTSSQPGDLLPTIRSRTLALHVPPLSLAVVEDFLVSVAGRAPADIAGAAHRSHGSIGRALGFLPDEGGGAGPLERLRGEALRLLEAALAPGPGEGFKRALEQRPWGARGLHDLIYALEEWVRDLAAAMAGADEHVMSRERADHLRSLASRARISPAAPARAQRPLEEAHLLARGNVNPQLLVAGMLAGLRRALLPPSTEGSR